MSDLRLKLTPADRMEMIQSGLNPLKEEHVRIYMNGGSGNIKENVERLTTLMGNDINRPIGHGKEIESGRISLDSHGDYQVNDIKSMKENLNRDMEEYASTSGQMSAVPQLSSLRNSSTQKSSLNEVQQRGKTLATNYYNAFITSLQQPSTQANYNVFKALKSMLEAEQSLKGTNGLKHFQESVRSISSKMYNQIKGNE